MLRFLVLLTVACALWSPVSAQESALKEVWFAGTGESPKIEEPYASGKPAGKPLKTDLGNPFGVEVRGRDLWITSVDDQCIYRGTIDGGPLRRIAGNGLLGYDGDGGSALEARFNWPHEVRADKEGNLFVADTRNHVIRRIDGESGSITTIAGNGEAGFAGDGLSGDAVQFRQPHSVVLDGAGGLLVADTVNHRLRRIDLETGVVQTISGTGQRLLPLDGSRAMGSPLFGPRSLAVDDESIWIALREGNSIWRLDRASGTLHHVAGTGEKGYSGDGGDPLDATFSGPKGLTMDDRGRLLVVDTENQAVRRIDLGENRIETILGERASKRPIVLKRPHGIAFSKEAGFFLADSENHRVLRDDDQP